jgi:hypothetical protein
MTDPALVVFTKDVATSEYVLDIAGVRLSQPEVLALFHTLGEWLWAVDWEKRNGDTPPPWAIGEAK